MKYNMVKLKDLCVVNQGLQIPISKRFKEPGENRYFYITVQFLKDAGEKYYIENPPKNVICTNDDILVVRTGNTGQIVTNVSGCFHNNFFKVTPNEKVYSRYMYYALNNPKMRQLMLSAASGTTIPDLKHSAFYELEIPLPSLDEQKKIAKVLDTINSKIRVNNEMNITLNDIGFALYQNFFEADNNSCVKKKLNEVTHNNRNKINNSNEYKVLSAVNTGELVLSDDYFDKQVYSKDLKKYLNVSKNDFAYNPARINIGSIGLNNNDFPCCVSPVYVTFSVDKNYIDFFNLYFKSKRFINQVSLRASGSVRQTLNYKDFGEIELDYPNINYVNEFNSLYNPIKKRIIRNKKVISNLEETRDILLPKLMNGEIELNNI